MKVALLLLAAAAAFAQRIEHFEVRNNRLFLSLNGENRIISTSAIAAWPGWLPSIVIYTERAETRERIRWYDSFTRNSQTIGFEDQHVADTTVVRLSDGSYSILLQIRDPKTNMPSVAIAAPQGIFYRERLATYGTAANDVVEIRRFDEEELTRTKGDVTLLKPAVAVNVPLTPATTSAAGIYESGAVTLNLRADGSATMVTSSDGGTPAVRRGTWSQNGFEVRAEMEGETIVWTASVDGLMQRGGNGTIFRRAEAPAGVPRRAPGTVR